MEGRLGKSTRHPVMKLLVDFDNYGYDSKDEWTDITEDILEINGSKEKSGKQIGSVTSDIVTFTADNIDKKFSNDNTNSPLYGKIKSNLKFRLLTGFQGETLIPYASGYVDSFTPAWKDKKISIKTTDYFKLFKEEKPPEESFQDISWDELVNLLCDHVKLPSFIVRHIPKTEFYYSYFRFEEENCFEALNSLMEIAVGEVYFEQEQFYVKTKLALDYQLDTTIDHDITTDDIFDFEENVDGQNVINNLSISSQYKAIGPLEIVFETPDNLVKVENELITYDGTGSIYVNSSNLPIVHEEDVPLLLTNLTQRKNIQTNGHEPNTGKIVIHPDSLADVAAGDTLSLSYSYQQLAMLAGKTRKFTFIMNQEVDSLQALDIAIWDEFGNQARVYSQTPDISDTVSQQGMTFNHKTNTVTLTLKNNYSSPVVFSTMQFRGYPIKVLTPLEVFVRDLPSVEEFGKKEVTIQNNYINNIKLAEKIGQYIVDNNKANRKRINIEIPGYPEFSLDDISKVTEGSSGTSHSFTNERIDYTYTPDSGWNVRTNLTELDSAPWVYESFKGESWEQTNSGVPDGDFLKDISANLIKNGGAELYTGISDSADIGAIDQKHIVPDYWKFTRTAGNASSRIRDGGNLVLHGLHSFEITTTNSGTGFYEQIVNGVKPNSTYTLSFDAQSTTSSGKATIEQYEGDILIKSDSINFSSYNTYELTISSLPTATSMLIKLEKLAGTMGVESLVLDKIKFENATERTIYIENEETSAIQINQRYANSLTIGNNYGIEVFDELDQTKVRLGQYEPNKYGLKIYNGAIEIENGLTDDNIANADKWNSYETTMTSITPHQIILSNENQSIITDSNGITKSPITIITGVDSYKGSNRIAGTIGTLLLKSSDGTGIGTTGVTLSSANPTITSGGTVTMTINSGVNLEADAGYIEIPITIESNSYVKKLTWNKAKAGEDGYTPVKGTDYFDGQDGTNGVSSYLWVSYSQNANGNPMTTDPTGALYIGIVTTNVNSAPVGYASYTWSLIKGTDGIQGEAGTNGQTSYLHIKYSNDGGATFTANNGEVVGAWIGTYVDFTITDSISVSAYTWNKVKGENGYTPIKGTDYFDGQDGQDGTSSYLHVRYSAYIDGNPMTDDPTNAMYIGLATTITPVAPTVYTSYTWSQFGIEGIPGEGGADGKTSYLHIKYSNDGGTTFTGNNGEDVGIYIGTYVDFSSTDSTIVSSYTWNKVRGDNGTNGKVADILSSSQIFKSTDGGTTFSPDTITLTPSLQNVTFSKWQYSTNGGTSFIDASGANGITIASNILTLSKSSTLFTGAITTLVFKLVTNDANIFDTLTIVKLYDVINLKDDLNMTAPLPTSIAMDANGITAYTSDAAKYARMDYRGLYIKGGAIQIDGGLSDGQIANSGKWNGQGTYIDETGVYTGIISFSQGVGGTLKLGETYANGDLKVWSDVNGDGNPDMVGSIDDDGAYFPSISSNAISGNVENTWQRGNLNVYFEVLGGNDNNDGSSWSTPKKNLQAYINSIPKNLNGAAIQINVRNDVYGGIIVDGFHNGSLFVIANTIEGTRRPRLYGKNYVKRCSRGTINIQGFDANGDPSSVGGTIFSVENSDLVKFYDVKVYGNGKATHAFTFDDSRFSLGECHAYDISDRGVHAFNLSHGNIINIKGSVPVAILVESGSIVTGEGTRWAGPVVRLGNSYLGGNNTDVWTVNTGESTPAVPPEASELTLSVSASSGDNYSTQGFWTNDEVKQGDYGYGNRFGLWYFGDLRATLAGKTIVSAMLTLHRGSGGAYSARTVYVKTHAYAARANRPAGQPSLSSEYNSGTLAVGETKTIDITSLIQTKIANSTDKSLGVSTSGSNDYMSLGTTPTLVVRYK